MRVLSSFAAPCLLEKREERTGMDRLRQLGCCALLLLGASACGQEPIGQTAGESTDRAPAATSAPAPAAGRMFDVDAGRSEVYWRVYKAGAFARFGHNHVISVGEMTGSVTLAGELAESVWELAIPVDALIVDDPELRDRYGEEFASEPSDEDVAGTRTNMLSETVLNGEVHPLIRIRGAGFEGIAEEAEFPVVIEMLGREIELALPGQLVVAGGELTVSGEFSLVHADLGMEPFSVMMGALQVGERLDFSYRIHAVERGR